VQSEKGAFRAIPSLIAGTNNNATMRKNKRPRNHLIKEQSPYLLQHSTNPVDWYPWCEEAFDRAKREQKPVFLSIGYATCHWCHVMAHESFEDPRIAQLLNETFVCIKVDREERPDIDHMYMTVCQLMTGTGGWPLTLVLTPDRVPFFAATYIPKHSRYNRKGMVDLIPQIDRAWREKQDTITQTTNQIRIALDYMSRQATGNTLTEEHIHELYTTLCDQFDRSYGGFSNAPKFPSCHTCMFLLRYWYTYGDPFALSMVEQTLGHITRGGIHDHIEGGFHRYATDRKWRVPHFEKMLYDQALLLMLYAELYQVTRKEEYTQEILSITDYVRSRLTGPDHAFYSAEDADSEGVEGKFYVWSHEEIQRLLKKDASLFCEFFGIRPEGNYQEESTGTINGLNILYRKHTIGTISQITSIDPGDCAKTIERALKKLRKTRARRIRPFLDDTILADWNGIMIAALAVAGRSTGLSSLIHLAGQAASYVHTHLCGKDGRLLHRIRGTKAGLPAHLDDYTFLSWGLIELYRATYDLTYLSQALALTDIMIADFWDQKQNKGFYFTSVHDDPLLMHQHITHDGALPSGNSVAYHILQNLNSILATERYTRYIERLEYFMSAPVAQNPAMHTFFLGSFLRNFSTSSLITIAGDRYDAGANPLHRGINDCFLPYTVTRFSPATRYDANLHKLIPDLSRYALQDGQTAAYVCANATCYPPATDIATIRSYAKHRPVILDSGSGDGYNKRHSNAQ
jgi:uncharacterized protein YyaL (SSP411 family)